MIWSDLSTDLMSAAPVLSEKISRQRKVNHHHALISAGQAQKVLRRVCTLSLLLKGSGGAVLVDERNIA
jgi:hypothetical protein